MRRLGANAGLLAAAQLGGQLIGLGMLTIVTRKIGPTYLGAYAFSYSIVGYVGLAATVGLPVLGMREVSKPSSDRRRVLIDTVAARVSLALLLGAGLIVISRWIAPSPASRVLLPILAIKLVIDALTLDWYLQGSGRHAVVAAWRFIGQIAFAAALLPLLASGLTGARHYIVANLVGLGVAAAAMLALAARDVGLRLGRPAIKQVRDRLMRSTPFLWWIALTQIYYSTDLILVAYLAGDRKAGLYAAASKLPLSVIGVASMWFTVSMPETARLHSAAQTKVIRAQSRVAATGAIVAGVPFMLLGPVFATDIAKALFGARFAAAGPALAILSVSVAVSLLQIVVTSVVVGAGRERPYVRAMAFGAGMNVALNLILIPLLGIVGAAISTIVSEGMVLIAGIAQLLHVTGRLEVRWRAIGDAVATGAIASLCAVLVRHEAGVVAGALGAIAIYVSVIGARTLCDRGWLNAWLGNTS